MVVSQPSRMHEHPALSRRSDAAVVADKPATSTLKTMCVQSIKIKFGKICVILKRWLFLAEHDKFSSHKSNGH